MDQASEGISQPDTGWETAWDSCRDVPPPAVSHTSTADGVRSVCGGRREKKASGQLAACRPKRRLRTATLQGENEEQTATRANATVQRPDDLFSFKQTEMFNFSWTPAALSFSRRQIEIRVDFSYLFKKKKKKIFDFLGLRQRDEFSLAWKVQRFV